MKLFTFVFIISNFMNLFNLNLRAAECRDINDSGCWSASNKNDLTVSFYCKIKEGGAIFHTSGLKKDQIFSFQYRRGSYDYPPPSEVFCRATVNQKSRFIEFETFRWSEKVQLELTLEKKFKIIVAQGSAHYQQILYADAPF